MQIPNIDDFRPGQPPGIGISFGALNEGSGGQTRFFHLPIPATSTGDLLFELLGAAPIGTLQCWTPLEPHLIIKQPLVGYE